MRTKFSLSQLLKAATFSVVMAGAMLATFLGPGVVSVAAQDRPKAVPPTGAAIPQRPKPAANPAAAQPKQAAFAPVTDVRPKYEVSGFREARFGMTEQEIRASVVKSFGVKDADIALVPNSMEGTTLLVVRVPTLDPGPGPATITYIFGYQSKRLIQVNVAWGDNATKPGSEDVANNLIGAGTRLERYFEGFAWRKDATRVGIPVGDNTVVLFSGEDENKGAVRVIVDGIKYQVVREGEQATSPEPKGPAKLIINYIFDRENPDIARIERGKF